MSSTKSGWYVLYTKPRHEKKITTHLHHLHLTHFLPLTRTAKISQGKKKYVNIPLFPSYIFVKLDNPQEYFDSLHIPGVLYYVRNGNKVAEVNEIVIQKLQNLSAHNTCGNIEISSEHFSRGSIVPIEAGPFRGFLCEVIKHKGKYQILVRIELLQRNIIVDMPSYCLDHTTRGKLVSE